VSAIAEHAGVQRHTVYSHFPDERSLFLACSGCYEERHPLPDPSAWTSVAGARERLHAGFSELYAYYAARGHELAPILRDVERHAMTREVTGLRMRPVFERMREVLSEPFHLRGGARRRLRATLDLFLGLHAFRVLAAASTVEQAVDAAVRAVVAQSDAEMTAAPARLATRRAASR
jgi:AcrR family transcriptional regulator